MDRFDQMRAFTRVVERRSFTLAAQDLGLPRSTVTDVIKHLEARLGVRLLERTTRHVAPTLDGEAYHQRCLALLAEIEDAEAAFGGARPRGLLRVNVQGILARRVLLPRLPEFIAQYPEIELFIGEGDRFVDVVREGFDCVLRTTVPKDSDMIARRVTVLEEVTCAAPSYIARCGLPRAVDDLIAPGSTHKMVGFFSTGTGAVLPLEFVENGAVRHLTLPSAISVNGAETYVAMARLGLGLIQVPRYHLENDFTAGTLVPVLPLSPPTPTPVSLLYPRNRQLSPRVRVFMEWVVKAFESRM